MSMSEGRIRYWNAERFFGFIDGGNGMSFFFHGRAVYGSPDDIQAGARVRFVASRTERGPCAIDIELLDVNNTASESGFEEQENDASEPGGQVRRYAAKRR